MTMSSKARLFVVLGAFVAFAPAVGCKKKDDSTTKATADDKKKKSGDDDDTSADFSRGDTLKHVPKSCKMARGYVDYAGLLADPALKVHASKIDDKIAESIKGENGKKAEKALEILKKAKVDPGKDIHEIAVCADSDQSVMVVVGGDFAGKDVLGAIQKISKLEDDPDKEMKKKDGDGFSYLKGKGKGIIAQITPNVFAMADDVDAFSDVLKSNDQSSKFAADKGTIVSVTGASKKDGVDEGSLVLTNKGDNQELVISATLSGKAKKEIGSDPDAAKKQIKQVIEELAKMVDSSPAADLADDLRAAKVKVDGDTVTISLKVPNKDLASSLQKLIDMKESDLEQLANK